MPRSAWFAPLLLAALCPGSLARAETRTTPPTPRLSVEVQRCLRIGQLPRHDREDAQLQCLANQDESGFVELVRAIAKRRHKDAHFGGERIKYLSWKVREALVKGRQEAAVAVETMLDDEPSPDIELETTALEAMRWVTTARREAAAPRGQGPGAERALVVAPRACVERVDAAELRVAEKAVACVAEAQAGIPTERLIETLLKKPERLEIWRLIKRLRKLPEPQARRLAEALVAKRDNDDRRADDLCEILRDTTAVDATWATLAGRRAFELFGVRQCQELGSRSQRPAPAGRDPTLTANPLHSRCLEVPVVRNEYVSVCAEDLGPASSDASQRGRLQVRHSRFSRYREEGVQTTNPWLLEGERLLVSELGYVTLTEPQRKNERWQEWDEAVVFVPSAQQDGSQRRLHLFGLRSRRLQPLWQSPECRQPGCRLDLVARRRVEDGELLGLLLLTERLAQPVAVSDLLERTLDERLGCTTLRPLALSECSRWGVP
jgi:hypothetical protein